MDNKMYENDMKIFAGSNGNLFASEISKNFQIPLGKCHTQTFSDNNIFVEIDENVKDKDIYLVQSISLNPNNEFVEILFWMDAFKRANAKSVTAVIPYFGYAKGDRLERNNRASIRARVCAECIDISGADRIITMDLHSEHVQGFFKKPVDNLSAMPLICDYIEKQEIENLVVVAPSSGFSRQGRKFSFNLDCPICFWEKNTYGNSDKKILDVLGGDLKGKNALIVDDSILTANTVMQVCKLLEEKGVNKIYVAVTHILADEETIDTLNNSDIVQVIATDTVFNPKVKKSSKIKILSAATIFAYHIKKIYENESFFSFDEKLPEELKKNIDYRRNIYDLI